MGLDDEREAVSIAVASSLFFSKAVATPVRYSNKNTSD
jgi:hypothetical protein